MKTSPGSALVDSITADLREQGLTPDARETELLARARAAADRIAELETLVATKGSTWTDKNGTVRPSPLLSEIRSTTLVLTRCLGGIQMNPGPAARNPVKVRAGQKSWAARVGREALKEQA
ncbi:MAG: hypothetical protein QOC62_1987 [Mycobacterium sp.]|jgi:hypothetical protein|nr:hypothetical protein [Mycobacterium sp.]